jgi:putative hemolysin
MNSIESARLLVSAPAQYQVRLVQNQQELYAAQALRYHVFNLELQEGLAESVQTGRDADRFDAVCEHLVVEHGPTRKLVGTYRLQTGTQAARHFGYYSEQEFDFRPYETWRGELLELGRACVHPQHRNLIVLGLLWKGIADLAQARGIRYLIGCSSLTAQDPAVGASAYADLCRHHLIESGRRTRPVAEYECSLRQLSAEPVLIPKLLRAYLSLGAKICGPPALDRHFKTIDFLTLLDLTAMPPLARQRFFSGSGQ